MSFSWIFGNIIELFIIITIFKVIYKAVIKGRSETLDSTVSKFVHEVKKEFGGSSKKNPTTAAPKNKIQDDYDFSTKPDSKYSNADDLLKSGLITREEYRKIRK